MPLCIVFQLRRLDAERREQATKQKAQEKKFDYMIRAFHLEEMKVSKDTSDEYRRQSEHEWEQYEKNRVAKAMYAFIFYFHSSIFYIFFNFQIRS